MLLKVIKRINTNGITEVAAGVQALEYLGGKVKMPRRRPNPKRPEVGRAKVSIEQQFVQKKRQLRKAVAKAAARLTKTLPTNSAYRTRLDDLEAATRRYWEYVDVYKRRNPSPVNEWDDDVLNESAMLGSRAARELGRSERAHRQASKFFNVTWYSPKRGKRTGFIRPIEAHTANDAKRQAKAMVENDPKASNFVAKELTRNPRGRTINAGIGEKIAQLTREGVPHNRAVAIAFSEKRAGRLANPFVVKFGSGSGYESGGHSQPFKTRQEADAYGLAKTGDGKTFKVLHYHEPGRSGPRAKRYEQRYGVEYGDSKTRSARRPKELTERLYKARREMDERRAKRNPSTREMSERFNGHASGTVIEQKAANGTPGDLSRGGELVFLKLAGRKGSLRIPGTLVNIDPKTERLWLTGNRVPLLNRKAKPGQRLDFGELESICYKTAKRHIEKGKLTEYIHKFDQPRPHLYVDAEGMPLIVGGNYKIRTEGIIH